MNASAIRPLATAVTISLVPQARGGPFVFWDDLPASCAQAAELGFDAVEVFAPGADGFDAVQLAALLLKHNLRLAALGTGAGWVVHKLQLTHPDAAIREKARAFIRDMIDLAARFEAPAILGSMQGRFEGAVSKAQAIAWLSEALEELGEHATRQGLPLLYEPLNRYETNLFNRAADVVAFLNSLRNQNVKVLADVFHMNIEEASVADAFHTYGQRLGHVHFADSNRHAVGFGHINYMPIVSALREINYNGYLSAEVLPLPDSAAAARQTLRASRELFGTH